MLGNNARIWTGSNVFITQIFFNEINCSTENWVMYYPFGAYNESLTSLLRKKKCKLAFSTKVEIATLNESNAFTLERLDTNDIPKSSRSDANEWARKVFQ